MVVHLIKLSVGPESLSELEGWQKLRIKQKKELMHITRSMPRRAEEIIAGGSIYWVIKGIVCARQKIKELRPLEIDGIPHCGIIYDKKMVRVQPRPHRPFQGWRYLETKDAPKDLSGDGMDNLPEDMLRELAELGLL